MEISIEKVLVIDIGEGFILKSFAYLKEVDEIIELFVSKIVLCTL